MGARRLRQVLSSFDRVPSPRARPSISEQRPHPVPRERGRNPRVEQGALVVPADDRVGLVVVVRLVAEQAAVAHDLALRGAHLLAVHLLALERRVTRDRLARLLDAPRAARDLVRGRGELDHRGDAPEEVERVLIAPDVEHDGDRDRRLVEHPLDPVLDEVRAEEIPELEEPLRLGVASVAQVPRPVARLAAHDAVAAPHGGGDVEARDEGAGHRFAPWKSPRTALCPIPYRSISAEKSASLNGWLRPRRAW